MDETTTLIEAEDPPLVAEAEALTSHKTLLHLLGQSANFVARLVTQLLDVTNVRILL